ncbi:MAG: hypothetical protein B7Z71_10235, partial [Acidocella sp. 21-58-7]
PYDANAIAVRFGALPLGFLRREIAARIAPNIDNGTRYRAHISALTGGGRLTVTGPVQPAISGTASPMQPAKRICW